MLLNQKVIQLSSLSSKTVKVKAATSKTSQGNIKVSLATKNSAVLLRDVKDMGYTVKYQFYRSTKKNSGYKAAKIKVSNTYVNTKGAKGNKYYYKARVLVYDRTKLVVRTALKQCSYGARTWSK